MPVSSAASSSSEKRGGRVIAGGGREGAEVQPGCRNRGHPVMTGGSLEPARRTPSEDETQASEAPAGLLAPLLAGDPAAGAQEGRAPKMLLLGGKLSPPHPGGDGKKPSTALPLVDHLQHCFHPNPISQETSTRPPSLSESTLFLFLVLSPAPPFQSHFPGPPDCSLHFSCAGMWWPDWDTCK